MARAAEVIGAAVEKAEEEVPDEEPEPLEADPLYEELRRGVIHLQPEAVEEDDEPEDEAEDGDEDGEDDGAPTRRIDFDNLKFGKDYEIT